MDGGDDAAPAAAAAVAVTAAETKARTEERSFMVCDRVGVGLLRLPVSLAGPNLPAMDLHKVPPPSPTGCFSCRFFFSSPVSVVLSLRSSHLCVCA